MPEPDSPMMRTFGIGWTGAAGAIGATGIPGIAGRGVTDADAGGAAEPELFCVIIYCRIVWFNWIGK